jgi:hypothetical protein
MMSLVRPDPSTLTCNELSSPSWVLDEYSDGVAGQHLRDQLGSVAVVARNAMHTDLAVPEACVAADVPDGPLDVRAVAYDRDATLIGFVTAWVEDGRLSCISMGWVTDEMPDDFPQGEPLRLAERDH